MKSTILALFLGLFFLTACELPDSAPVSISPTPTATLPPLALSVDIEDDAIIVPIPIDPPSFNAYLNDTGYEELIGELVYGALAEIGPDGNYYPELALDLPTLANGGLSEDGRTVTWHLRPGAFASPLSLSVIYITSPQLIIDIKTRWETFSALRNISLTRSSPSSPSR